MPKCVIVLAHPKWGQITGACARARDSGTGRAGCQVSSIGNSVYLQWYPQRGLDHILQRVTCCPGIARTQWQHIAIRGLATIIFYSTT